MSGQGTPPPGAPPAGPATDQSMEDILASIRRILNEDEVPPAPASEPAPAESAATAPAEPPPADEANGPLVLTEDMMVGGAADPAPMPEPEPEPPVVVVVEPPPPPMEAVAVSPPLAALPSDALLAPAVAAAATASVSQLVRAVANERGSAVHRGGPSIEDVVREELRPLLKEWLDQHLPGIVDRLVRAEIERVVGRALS
ncbi:DUF2497 domain-containing protein [Neoroseomonas rubea]|uniref:DUF2497 domain-containing protein n=1 Tax=Neoroseomonas rubea TaxID=2748666 RepID=UPI0018DF5C1C|nr:DUF2497 domain-containing protein [Roseomonas rubea]